MRARGQRLVRTAYLLTGDRVLAEDLVQNALASALTSWRRLRDVADMDAYMHTALVNARSRWWSRRWHGEIPSYPLPDRATPDASDEVDGRRDVVAALRLLPPKQRAAVVLRYFQDLTEVQTAQVLGCSVGNVKSQTSRGLAKLRAVLDPVPADDGRGRS